ncbi:dnaQ exonuclease/DinG family helicase [Brevibacillus laterosporus GI-9]|uniref:ATP-dependent DNA helicase DinG n=1 Tax=Brevibacillus laterosporus TaxID=1465 RepID=UPI0002403991|nr:ATP-dependent DNA helicase DinG [Brevibacillus laterosporus]CCF14132.1 dnaQ exonuclease/DinG family helicase [Brevibacillus laterosporus GI-9]
MKQFIVVDFETTGNQPRRGDSIIQIGAVVVENGQIIESYSTFVKPDKPIPPFITQLTGITDEMVSDAPSIEEVLPDLLRLLDGRTFVAHNAGFDLNFLQEALLSQGYYPFDGPILDTVELARVLLPMQSGYRLVELASDFDIQHENPHQADSDAIATAHLLLRLLDILYKLPLITIQGLQMMISSFRFDVATLLREIEMEKLMHSFPVDEAGSFITASSAPEETSNYDIYRNLGLKRRKKWTEKQSEQPPIHFSFEPFFERMVALDGDGLALHHEHYEKRESQEAMMHAVYQAFTDQKHLLVEAGTGTGKSLGYLLPGILWARMHKQQVIVSTHTIHLQDQLFGKDIPLLQKALPFSFRAAQLKGRGNYLCLRKFEQSIESQEGATQDIQLAKAQILTWLTETTTGDVEELSLSPSGQSFWQSVRSDTASCLNRECPWFSRCFYFQAKQQAKEADVIIVNHALLIGDIDKENGVLPSFEVAIIDEAHQLDEVASQHFGTQLSSIELFQLVEQLGTEGEKQMLLLLANELKMWQPAEKVRIEQHLQQMRIEQQMLKEAVTNWLQLFYHWGSERGMDTGESQRATLRYKTEDFKKKYKKLAKSSDLILQKLGNVAKEIEQLLRILPSSKGEAPYSLQRLQTDAAGLVEEISQVAVKLHFLLVEEQDEYVSWMEIETRTSRKQLFFFKTPLDIADTLRTTLLEPKRSIIMTSATLTVKNRFTYFMERMGFANLPEERVETLSLPSPFDYAQQGLILIPSDFPSVNKEGEQRFVEAVIAGCVDAVRASEGRTMILFTSYSMLRTVYEGMKSLLEGEEFELLGHGVDSSNRSKLVRRFQTGTKTVLLGTNSFWEGVDIPGNVLSCLIIVRLPFQPPNQPLLEGRSERLKAEKKNPFMTLSLPHAVIRFKQGVGRLIRQQTDSGVVIVFDTRIIESKYGRMFLQSLPPYQVETGSWTTLRERIAPFLQ